MSRYRIDPRKDSQVLGSICSQRRIAVSGLRHRLIAEYIVQCIAKWQCIIAAQRRKINVSGMRGLRFVKEVKCKDR